MVVRHREGEGGFKVWEVEMLDLKYFVLAAKSRIWIDTWTASLICHFQHQPPVSIMHTPCEFWLKQNAVKVVEASTRRWLLVSKR